MINKIKKYYDYVSRFVRSPHKATNIKVLIEEIKEKGLITGIQSILHIKSGNYVPDVDAPNYDEITKEFTKQFDKSIKVTLPYNEKPLVSIIIPTYNQVQYTYDCIRSIYEHNTVTDYEIIVADDNSPDDNIAVLHDQFDNLIIVKTPVNMGFLKNCNHAAKSAKGDYLIFLNNDTQVLDNWLGELLFVFDNFPKAGLVGSKLIYPNGMLQEAGGIIWQDGSASNFGSRGNPAHHEYSYIKEADYISGASIMVKRSLWDEAGGFDERFSPAYTEDTDLCFQIRAMGYKVYFQPFSQVIHFEGISHGTDTGKGIKQYQVFNKEKFVAKWSHEIKQKSKRNKNMFFERDRTMGKKHVLIIDHNVPTIDKDAGSRTMSNYIDSMISLGYSVKFLVPNMFPTYAYTKLLQQKGVEVLHGEEFVYWGHKWEAYFAENLDKFDAILLSRSSICIPYIKYLNSHNYEGKTIYYGHDLGFLRTEQELLKTGDASLKKVIKKTKADEDYMYQSVDHALVISYEEMAYLKNYITTPLHYIPPYFFDVQKTTAGFDERNGILFVGGFHHPPNQEAMKWFLNEMYPELDKLGIPLTVAGSEMPDFMYKYQKKFKSLTILPDVPNEQLETLYATARIAIVPLTVGAGVKGKVIEAMAKGVPIVGTDKAFEGLNKEGKFLYKDMNTPPVFVEEIKRIYNNKAEWTEMATFGKDYVSKYFNRDIMKQVLKDIIE